jgi:hypothetical protein
VQKLSLISIVTLLAIGSVGSIVTVAMNPFNANHIAAPQIQTPNHLGNVTTTSSVTGGASSMTSNNSTLPGTNSTGLLTGTPTGHSSGSDDGSGGDDGGSGFVTTHTTSLNATRTGDD